MEPEWFNRRPSGQVIRTHGHSYGDHVPLALSALSEQPLTVDSYGARWAAVAILAGSSFFFRNTSTDDSSASIVSG